MINFFSTERSDWQIQPEPVEKVKVDLFYLPVQKVSRKRVFEPIASLI